MCHVLVASDPKTTREKEKEFQRNKIREIKKKNASPTIQFVYGRTKKSEKTIDKYQKKHPRAQILDERSVA